MRLFCRWSLLRAVIRHPLSLPSVCPLAHSWRIRGYNYPRIQDSPESNTPFHECANLNLKLFRPFLPPMPFRSSTLCCSLHSSLLSGSRTQKILYLVLPSQSPHPLSSPTNPQFRMPAVSAFFCLRSGARLLPGRFWRSPVFQAEPDTSLFHRDRPGSTGPVVLS